MHNQEEPHPEIQPLETQESLMSGFLESWIDGIIVASLDGRILNANSLGIKICQSLEAFSDTSQLTRVPEVVWGQFQSVLEKLFDHDSNHHVIAEAEIKNAQNQFIRIRIRPMRLGESQEKVILLTFENQYHMKRTLAESEGIAYGLTPREADVRMLHRTGLTYREIASELGISLNTVKRHIKGVYAKKLFYDAGTDRAISLNIEVNKKASSTDEIATELSTLCKALNAYHIACGGNGLEIDDWETLFAVRKLEAA